MRRSMIKGLGICLAVSLLLASGAWAQNPTGILTGRVTADDGTGLPGVVVSATADSLQGERNAVTGANGGYKLGFLPPGTYHVSYGLEGFATVVLDIVIPAAQTKTSDIQMQLAEVTEEIVVTSNVETISESNTAASTYTQDEVEKLPILRNITNIASLAPGVHNTGPSGNITINGAMSFENVWMINGVVINENVRGQSLPLFIEDAIEESTVQTGGISAEYGRFTGGVVNVITKTGGNQFSGSLRVNFTNDDWLGSNDLSPERMDDRNETYEATLGGAFWTDRIWFFLAGRDQGLTGSTATDTTNITIPTTDDEQRIEAKLTLSPHPSHQIQASYLDLSRSRSGTGFGPVRQIDERSYNANRTDPQEIQSINYTGILTSSFFLEAQYSERDFAIGVGSGGPSGDLINGTFIRSRGGDAGRVQYHAPFFCGDCETEVRNNENALVKGSYFFTSEGAGSHDLAFGYDTFTDIRFAVNHQTGSDFQVWSNDLIITGDANNTIYPVIDGSTSWLVWWPPVNLDIAAPTDFTTNSFYVNDTWQLSDKWSFNVGVRYDQNDGQDSGGQLTVDDAKVSPRLGMSYDIKGDGDTVLNASYGTYVAAIANTRADDTSPGGQLAGLGFFYGGRSYNTDCTPSSGSGCTQTEDVLQGIFDWYLGNGGTTDAVAAFNDVSALPGVIFSCFPGATNVVPDTLRSPASDEFTVGVSKRLGTKGLFRADVVFREWDDFYSNRTTVGLNLPELDSEIEEVGNFGNDALSREYVGLNLIGRYRFTDRFTLSGNYTWSELTGNINGETAGSGPVPLSPNAYPEYKAFAENNPVGPLGADQEHRTRLWGIYDIIENRRHGLSVSLLYNYFSGTPFSLAGSIDSRPYVDNPGYLDPPDTVGYFFTPRGSQTTEGISRTDLSLNYAFRWNALGKGMEIFIQPEVINVFNSDGITGPNTDVETAEVRTDLEVFNPFTENPIQGIHWDTTDDFGRPTREAGYQQVRTFRFSVGFRF